MHKHRRSLSQTFAFATLLSLIGGPAALAGCSQTEDTITLPEKANQLRNRSVRIDAGQCVLTNGTTVPCLGDLAPADGLKAVDLRGVNGTAAVAVPIDQDSDFLKNFGNLLPYWHRIPVGYGCGATLQGIFPNGAKAFDDPASYNFAAMDALIKASHDTGGYILWTAAYDLGDGKGTCTYANGQQQGKPIADIAKWAKVVRQVARHYDRDLPSGGTCCWDGSCANPPAGYKTTCENTKKTICDLPTRPPRPWSCGAKIYNIEFMRDPFGAGGYTAATKQQWLDAYKAFATELRQEFPQPGNDVALIGPSVVIHSALEVQNFDKSNTNRSPIFDFIDFVVEKQLALTFLSFEVEADSPLEVQAIATTISKYAATKGLHYEKNFSGSPTTGTAPIPLFLTDLHLTKSNYPASLKSDPRRLSEYKNAFYAACKMLLQGTVRFASVTHAPRWPTLDAKVAPALELDKNARASDNFWFNEKLQDGTVMKNGALKPAAWHAFWFNFLSGKQILGSTQGPDASGTGTGEPKGTVDVGAGVVVLGTKESCVNNLKEPVDCVVDQDTDQSVIKGRQRMLRVMIADLNVEKDNEVLEHILRVDVTNITKTAKTVGYQWAYLDPTSATWSQPTFTDSGVIDASNGEFHITKSVAVPSVHYFQFLY